MINSAIDWLRKNLFFTWYHSILSILIICVFVYLAIPILNWLIFKANFIGTGPEACTSGGACWVFIKMRFNQFMYGFYPRDLEWRINVVYMLGVLNILAFFFSPQPYKKWCILFLIFIYPLIALVFFYGGILGLEQVDTYSWTGFHLTFVLTFGSILCAFPVALISALCRNSKLFIIRGLSILFIEIWRGVPLISVLFMASLLIPMFFGDAVHFDKVLRALIGITLFYSAYLGEEIRTGLQTLPRGQYEAAQALGFAYPQSMRLVILPQALKKVIPGMVNTIISMFKDTTLVLTIGLFDLFGMIQAASADPKWLAYGLEGYVFAAFVYWLICYLMSKYSAHLDKQLNS